MRNQAEVAQERQRLLVKLEKRRQGLYNEMEFVEILAQFWPWSNMAEKVDRLQSEIGRIDQQKHQLSAFAVC